MFSLLSKLRWFGSVKSYPAKYNTIMPASYALKKTSARSKCLQISLTLTGLNMQNFSLPLELWIFTSKELTTLYSKTFYVAIFKLIGFQRNVKMKFELMPREKWYQKMMPDWTVLFYWYMISCNKIFNENLSYNVKMSHCEIFKLYDIATYELLMSQVEWKLKHVDFLPDCRDVDIMLTWC